jgi:hypothetical protein
MTNHKESGFTSRTKCPVCLGSLYWEVTLNQINQLVSLDKLYCTICGYDGSMDKKLTLNIEFITDETFTGSYGLTVYGPAWYYPYTIENGKKHTLSIYLIGADLIEETLAAEVTGDYHFVKFIINGVDVTENPTHIIMDKDYTIETVREAN